MNLEDFLYKKIIKSILYKSTLGKNSIDGNADTGFNFEYMYKNTPSGDGLLGKVIDKFLLNLPAVQATRNRKETIKSILNNAIKNANGTNKSVKILDVASGPARYLVELGAETKEGFEALCLDNDVKSLNQGKQLAKQYSAAHLIKYKQFDVFNEAQLKNISFNPDVLIASGLYVYHDDSTVKKSIEIFSHLLTKDKKILVDNQIKNPSRKLMEKVCTTTQGKSWKLHYRSEEHMISLLEPWFKTINSSIDEWGMYNLIIGAKK